MSDAPRTQSEPVDFAAFADGLMAAGDQLAEKLRAGEPSPWTTQILEEWAEAKDIRWMLP